MKSDVARDLEDDITWPAKSIKASDFAECQAHRKRTNDGDAVHPLHFHDTTHATLSLLMLGAQAHITFLSCPIEKSLETVKQPYNKS